MQTPRSDHGERREETKGLVVAIGIDNGKSSQSDHLLQRGETVILIHVKANPSSPDHLPTPHEEHRQEEAPHRSRDSNMDSFSDMSVRELLQRQLEVQTQLSAQLEIQQNLQQAIEEQVEEMKFMLEQLMKRNK